MVEKRVQRILSAMEAQGLSQMLISDPGAIYYLTGKWIHPGERMLALYLNINGKHKLIVNELFPIAEDLGVDLVTYCDTDAPVQLLAQFVDHDAVMGIDKTWPARFLIQLMDLGAGSKFINSSPIVDHIRLVKDEEEIEHMRKASLLNDAAMEKIQEVIKPGMSETEVADILAGIYNEVGANGGFSFHPIIAYGANAADPHHGNDASCIAKEGDCVIIDMGCIHNSYCSDMTRTIFLGEPSEHQKEIYDIVLQANLAGIAAVKPGARFCDVDKACRDYITAKGYGPQFLHRTGHAIGLECHEFGDVSSINTDVLKPGMIFSIEPGVYLAGDVGVRIEDLVLVTEDGCEVLNHFSKELKSK